ncbi:MAG: choice-of-anchor L domain-containing protein [Cryomorphaceae bacterium]
MKSLLTTFRLSFFSLLLFFSADGLRAQVSVDTTMTVEELVNDVLLGGGISATNITYNGLPADSITFQAGSFTVDSSAFPIAEGVVMATGEITGIVGGFENSSQNQLLDDPDLMAISGQPMNNCAIIEFDFTADTDTFLIDYVFASTEYPGFTCSVFNDAFGIFLSGPGISGQFSNNAANIALIPDTDIPVAINTVNGGAPTGGGWDDTCLEANPNYVEDSIYFFNNDPQLENSIIYPGHTHMFTAFASLVPGETYHFKFAIGNAVDMALQSAVMMRKGSVTGGLVTTELQIGVDTEGFEIAEEGVYIAGTFNFFIPEPMEQIGLDSYKFSVQQPSNVNITYKFFNGNDLNAAELVPENCSINGVMSGGNRFVSTSTEATTVETVCFGECGSCEVPLSIEDESQTKLGVFPNPSDGNFQIVPPIDGFARVQAFDVRGRMVVDTRVYVNAGNPVAIELTSKGLFKVRLNYEGNVENGYAATVVVN